MSMSTDRRIQKRDICDMLLNKVQGGHMNVVRALDISLSGMRLQRLLEPQRCEGNMRLQFSIDDDDEPIWVGATAMWQEEDCVGVKFTDISHQHFQRLRRWLMETTG